MGPKGENIVKLMFYNLELVFFSDNLTSDWHHNSYLSAMFFYCNGLALNMRKFVLIKSPSSTMDELHGRHVA